MAQTELWAGCGCARRILASHKHGSPTGVARNARWFLLKLLEKKTRSTEQGKSAVTHGGADHGVGGRSERTGKWPTKDSGFLAEAPGEKWSAIGTALIAGLRGLPGGSSLAKFLEEKRGARNQLNLPALTHEQILQWADTDKDRTGDWPNRTSGAIPETPGETGQIQQARCCDWGFVGFPATFH